MGNLLIKVAEVMLPLYMVLGLGYVSLWWCRLILQEQCMAVDLLVFYIIVGAQSVAGDLRGAGIYPSADLRVTEDQERPSYCEAITSFSLTQLTNALVVGVPLAMAMYGQWEKEVVVQLSVMQAVVWLRLLQFVFEIRKVRRSLFSGASPPATS
ncbi:hypothetical protein ZIOFF_070239 [Zingiber officinale]|uniref:Uncharacterized protein n=1 Tax=Zingiber officinale TaxID=94328 RepID=A0A8J5EUF0_ZINOF|nr:hypothetical protein ZIOFF_070239 [Zingiber officinale]